MTYNVELLWFADCANHPSARRMLEEVIAEVAPGTAIHDVDASDPVGCQNPSVMRRRTRGSARPADRAGGPDVATPARPEEGRGPIRAVRVVVSQVVA